MTNARQGNEQIRRQRVRVRLIYVLLRCERMPLNAEISERFLSVDLIGFEK